MMTQLDHEKLTVYQTALRFVAWAGELLSNLPKNVAVHNQLDRAMTSIPLNLAEGNGRHTPADRCRFFDNARGSALECGACLDVLVARKLVELERADEGKAMLVDIVSMTVGLIRANSKKRVV